MVGVLLFSFPCGECAGCVSRYFWTISRMIVLIPRLQLASASLERAS